MFVKFIPAFTLIALNTIMIKDFQNIIKRRTTLCIQKPKMSVPPFKGEEINLKLKHCKQRLRKFAKKDRNVIKLLLSMSIIFALTNLPMAIARILHAFGYHHYMAFNNFVILSNTLEVIYAASNFYLYCVCNSQFRNKVYYLLDSH